MPERGQRFASPDRVRRYNAIDWRTNSQTRASRHPKTATQRDRSAAVSRSVVIGDRPELLNARRVEDIKPQRHGAAHEPGLGPSDIKAVGPGTELPLHIDTLSTA